MWTKRIKCAIVTGIGAGSKKRGGMDEYNLDGTATLSIQTDEVDSPLPAGLHAIEEGVDYAGHGTLNYPAFLAAGKHFVIRYVSHSAWKNATKAEIDAFAAIGVKIGLVWETTATRATTGMAAGKMDAYIAYPFAASLGMPSASPLFFAVDQDVVPNAADPYFQGINTIAGGSERVGAYGGRKVIAHLFDVGLISYGWQTLAWSHGVWDPRAQIHQYNNNNHPIGGAACDLDRTVHADAGLWLPGSPQPKPPTPAPTPDNSKPVLKPTIPYMRDSNSAPDQPIRWVQTQLNAVKLPCAIDGLFGPETEHAVRLFQSIKHLTVDGIVGPLTWSALEVS